MSKFPAGMVRSTKNFTHAAYGGGAPVTGRGATRNMVSVEAATYDDLIAAAEYDLDDLHQDTAEAVARKAMILLAGANGEHGDPEHPGHLWPKGKRRDDQYQTARRWLERNGHSV